MRRYPASLFRQISPILKIAHKSSLRIYSNGLIVIKIIIMIGDKSFFYNIEVMKNGKAILFIV